MNEVVREIEAGGGKALVIKADGADAAAVKAAVAETVEHFGRLDVLVNNAGVLLLGPVADFSLEDLDRILAGARSKDCDWLEAEERTADAGATVCAPRDEVQGPPPAQASLDLPVPEDGTPLVPERPRPSPSRLATGWKRSAIMPGCSSNQPPAVLTSSSFEMNTGM